MLITSVTVMIHDRLTLKYSCFDPLSNEQQCIHNRPTIRVKCYIVSLLFKCNAKNHYRHIFVITVTVIYLHIVMVMTDCDGNDVLVFVALSGALCGIRRTTGTLYRESLTKAPSRDRAEQMDGHRRRCADAQRKRVAKHVWTLLCGV